MKLGKLSNLPVQLRKELAPIFIVAGDEPLQIEEVCDTIRAAAREQGYTERIVHHADRNFVWQEILAEANSLSLFASKQLIEVRVAFDKIGDGKKVLQEYAEHPPPDTILMLITSRITKKYESTKWFSALERNGLYVQIWPIESHQMGGWIGQRLQRNGMRAEADAITLLADLLEGNLLAAAQAIEQLKLVAGTDKPVTVEMVQNVVADSARYDVFGLTDAVLAGDIRHSLRIYNGLMAEGTEPTIILWALAKELRLCNHLANGIRQGSTLEMMLNQVASIHKQVPFLLQKKRGSYKRFLDRHRERDIREMVAHAALIDRALKGAEPTLNSADELRGLTMRMAGLKPH